MFQENESFGYGVIVPGAWMKRPINPHCAWAVAALLHTQKGGCLTPGVLLDGRSSAEKMKAEDVVPGRSSVPAYGRELLTPAPGH